MATKLQKLLKDTMLLTAEAHALWNNFDATQPSNPSQVNDKSPWDFSVQSFGSEGGKEDLPAAPPLIQGLTCYAKHRKKSLLVCREISWGQVAVAVGKIEYDLPLAGRFLIGHYSTTIGKIKENDTHAFWRLKAEVTRGIQLVYGFRLRDKGRGVEPYPSTADEDYDYFSEEARTNTKVKAKRSTNTGGADGNGATTTVDTVKIIGEVLVCASLVCCSAAKDFEPTESLVSARFYPQISLIASLRLSKARGRITMVRPTKSDMGHHSDMTHHISSGLFTDRNSFELSLLKKVTSTWEDIFDYYHIDPTDGTQFRAVRLPPGDLSPDLEERLIRKEWHFNKLRDSVVEKTLRQGEFDNLHLAPKMKHGKHEAFMAPVCQHDCVHTHWRWSEGYKAKAQRGWSDANPQPFSKAGAPMVPPNQAITITTIVGPGFQYDGFIDGPIEARTLQVINHHGSTYALELDAVVGSTVDGSFYHNMRFNGDHERIQYRGGDAGLLELRKLGSLDGEDQEDLWKRITVSEPRDR